MSSLLCWEGQAAALLLVALAVRFLLRRRSRRLVMPLWWVCLLRLLCPLSLPLLPAGRSLPILPALSGQYGISPGSAGGRPAAAGLLEAIWLAGAAALLLRLVFRRWRLGRALRFAVREEEGVWCCDALSVPCAAGVLRGRVYLPFRLPEEVRRQALRHERTHLRRRDPLLLLLSESACALHWWNPLVWLASAALREDMELCCDELTLRGADGRERRAYFEAMLHFAAPAGLGPCFAASQAERRAVHIAGLRPLSRRAAGGLGAALLLCALPCFLTAPPVYPAAELPEGLGKAAFAAAVCDAAAREDVGTLAALVRYPLTLRRNGEQLRLEGPGDFSAAYGRIMGPETRADLLCADPSDLLENYAGVMIGQGSVWFEETAENGFQIIAINEMK